MGAGTHKANIQDGGNAVHVVFKYLSRSLLWKGVRVTGDERLPTTLFPNWSVIIKFKDDVTIILLLGISFILVYFECGEGGDLRESKPQDRAVFVLPITITLSPQNPPPHPSASWMAWHGWEIMVWLRTKHRVLWPFFVHPDQSFLVERSVVVRR